PAKPVATPSGAAKRTPIAATSPEGADGIAIASNAAGTSHHAMYAARAPNARRSGRRASSTSETAALPTSVAWTISAIASRLSIVELLEQLAQLRDVLRAELALAAEMRDQRRDAAVEQPLQQAFAFVHQPGLPAQHGRVEVAAAVLGRPDRALLQQAVEQRLDGGFLPVLAPRERGHHVLGGERRAAPGLSGPEDFHHHRFGFADLHRLRP